MELQLNWSLETIYVFTYKYIRIYIYITINLYEKKTYSHLSLSLGPE